VSLLEFLRTNEAAILATTEAKAHLLAGPRPAAAQMKRGLPVFFKQLLDVLARSPADPVESEVDSAGMVRAAYAADEPAIARAAGRPYEAEVALSAGAYGIELQKSGYTLSHVVHGYGAICQAITELAVAQAVAITTAEFRQLNQCLDTAIAGAVTTFQAQRAEGDNVRETEHLGFLAHELRNALSIVNISLRLIQGGTVGFGGSTGQVLDRALKRINELINRSLTEVRMRVDPKVHKEPASLLQLVNQIAVSAEVEARAKGQELLIDIDPDLQIDADQYLLFSALSNLVQNAVKYSHAGGTIRIRGGVNGDRATIEVEDECGGLGLTKPSDLFKPFEQHNHIHDGLGLGLTIAQRAIELNGGTIDVENLPGEGCIFRITLPDITTTASAEPTVGVNLQVSVTDATNRSHVLCVARANSRPPASRPNINRTAAAIPRILEEDNVRP
jgi:signal transduction histidine kinase